MLFLVLQSNWISFWLKSWLWLILWKLPGACKGLIDICTQSWRVTVNIGIRNQFKVGKMKGFQYTEKERREYIKVQIEVVPYKCIFHFGLFVHCYLNKSLTSAFTTTSTEVEWIVKVITRWTVSTQETLSIHLLLVGNLKHLF